MHSFAIVFLTLYLVTLKERTNVINSKKSHHMSSQIKTERYDIPRNMQRINMENDK
jgi:hypothetical protein